MSATDPSRWYNGVLVISRSGTATQPITYEADSGAHPVITTAGNANVWDGVQITGAYINFTGFEVIGSAQNITLAQATATAQTEDNAYVQSAAANKLNPWELPIIYPGDALTNSNCISIKRTAHVTIKNNLVHDCSASGIATNTADYIFIEGNVVFNTSWWTVLDTSGINIFQSYNSDEYTGYKNHILNNISHDNGNTQAFYNASVGKGLPTDGNGIIIDSNQVTNDGNPYVGRTLVMGNIVYNNGGSGIHAFVSAHVDIYNNTGAMNNVCPVPGSTCGALDEGQIFAALASDVNLYNNIMYAPTGKSALFERPQYSRDGGP